MTDTTHISRIGLACDHAGYDLKVQFATMLRDAGYEVVDFGSHMFKADDDYPDYVAPLARAVAANSVNRGIAVCGSGVGACVAANKINKVRACLVTDTFSAHQGQTVTCLISWKK